MESKKKNLRFLGAALALCLVSMVGASIIQTSGGTITIKDLRWETPSGHLMSALLFIPENATAATPAPAIVTSHGWYNNREMQDLNYVEWSRRGYVVMSIDMYGHGHSDVVSTKDWAKAGTGMYDAVKLMVTLPYVDKTRVGVTGHSNGARAANWSIKEDNLAEKPLISAVFLAANDAMYTTDPAEPLYTPFVKPEARKPFTNNYGTRDVGILAANFDEFFFRSINADGSKTKPREYINTLYAQSFLHFGADPKTAGEVRSAYKIYKKQIDGVTASRVIYNPYQIHPWNHFSATCAASGIEFFEDALGAPNPIDSSKQIWQAKVFFNFLGLIGFVMFIISFTKALLYTEAFSSLRATSEVKAAPALTSLSGKLWFVGSSLVIAVLAGVVYLKIYAWTVKTRPPFFPQFPTYYIGMWSAILGLIILLGLVLNYQLYSKKNGLDLRATGALVSFKTLLKTIGLAVTVVAGSFSLVFIADYFFKADFRAWVLTVRTFTPDKIGIALKYMPLFLAYYIVNSVAINSFNYFMIAKKEWVNTAVVAGFAALMPVVMVAIHYITFFAEGEPYFKGVSNIVGIWLFPVIVFLPVAAIVSRKIYRATRNPYLPGLIMGMVVTLIACSNTLTQF
jgi:hypothetical protein